MTCNDIRNFGLHLHGTEGQDVSTLLVNHKLGVVHIDKKKLDSRPRRRHWQAAAVAVDQGVRTSKVY